MLSASRRLGTALALALLSALTLFVATAGQTSAGLIQQSATLTLEPVAGPPGTRVTATGDGYGDCSSNDDVGPESASVVWYGTELETVDIEDGTFSATFLVPESASLDTIHKVLARCAVFGDAEASREFKVTAPVEVPVVVPNLVGMTVGEARDALDGARLELGEVSGTGDVVRDQDPTAGTEVEPGTAVAVGVAVAEPSVVVVPDLVGTLVSEAPDVLEPLGLTLGGVSGEGDTIRSQSPVPGSEVPSGTAVDVTVGPPTPRLVTVPGLVDLNIDDAPGILESTGLMLGQVSGRGDVIRGQIPAAGALVPSGSAVNVTLEATTPPARLVEVPDLVDGTVDEARAVLGDVGLVLGNDPAGASTVESQAPAAGTLVPAETTVTVTVSQATVPISERTPLWPVAAALIVLGGALMAPRVVRARRGPQWVRAHVRISSGTAPGSDVEVTPTPADRRPTPVVRIEPHADGGTQVLEEVHR
jgi:beta-lactam-binding protein with PASTA domain